MGQGLVGEVDRGFRLTDGGEARRDVLGGAFPRAQEDRHDAAQIEHAIIGRAAEEGITRQATTDPKTVGRANSNMGKLRKPWELTVDAE